MERQMKLPFESEAPIPVLFSESELVQLFDYPVDGLTKESAWTSDDFEFTTFRTVQERFFTAQRMVNGDTILNAINRYPCFETSIDQIELPEVA